MSAPEVEQRLPHEAGKDAKPVVTDTLVENARLASDKEHKMTLMEGVRLYPKAVAWSMLISTLIVMEGCVQLQTRTGGILNAFASVEPPRRG